ncbi:hypothetical protein H8A99_35475 [Bradyrhizobium sp. Arg68]|uniref:hypothetical protein n=1 Tax=Bradyrhizobium ivorense TaxID=2511166 RepID=UPI0010B89B35|nr:hypothetical protein [Bradyrhizobium ivorense]MCC8941597.1 hypothetical protein [Bradyrhizobium ivorense]VIO74065.1 hypothetical protein CI41S_41770 [Bradyrhizobium ivorense]
MRVRTDDGDVEIWLAATPIDEALDRVLDVIPEGWTVSLDPRQIGPEQIAVLNMTIGEIRRYQPV